MSNQLSQPGDVITDDVMVEFRVLPDDLRDSAERLLAGFLKMSDASFLTPREVAAIIAGPSFRQILEQEARLGKLTLGTNH